MSDITVNSPSGSNVIVANQETQSIVVRETRPNFSVNGIVGGGSDAHYVHIQGSPSSTWQVQHNLNKKPSVTVVSSTDAVVYGIVEYIDNNNVRLTFESGAFSGKAYFN